MTVKELLERGVEKLYPSREFVEKRLEEGKPLTVYLGIDPTGPTLHIGHMIAVRKLAQFQQLGHKVILLLGDFTATIGDPDKLSVRVPLTEAQVHENAKLYKQQLSHLLDFEGNNPAVIKYNSEWLSKLSFADTLNLLSKVTYAQIIQRDMFKKRIAEERDLYFHEFLYPIMQGYDSVAMDVDGEIGGSDQTFNMLVGRDLMKKMKGKEKFVLTTKLLADKDGVKMGKTTGNMVSLDQSPEEMFGAVMSWTDGMIVPGFELCTDMPVEEIQEIAKNIESGANPMEYKFALAAEIVKQYHGEDGARAGCEHFERVVRNKEMPEEMQEVKATKGTPLAELLKNIGLVKSKAEFTRLVKEGAVELMGKGIIESPQIDLEASVTVRIGKRRFVKISIG